MSFVPHKAANASPPRHGRPTRNSSTTSAPKLAEASVELRFTTMLRQRTDFAIEGRAASGEVSLALYKWNGSHWKYIHPETARALALAWLEKHSPKDYTARQADACIATAATAQMQSATAVSTLEAQRGRRVIVPLQDKYLELIDGQWHVLDPDPKLGMTYAVPAHVDPAKITDGIYTPSSAVPPASKFGGYLARLIPEQEDQDKLSEIAATSLIPGGMEKAFLLLGGGANGKSTILHVLEAFHPTTNTAIRIEHLDRPFGLGAIPGKSLAIAWEVPPFIDAEANEVLKSLVSRDSLQIEKKHRDAITITPRATIYMAANSPPRFADKTYGHERKIEAFAFNQCIAEQDRDPSFAKKITEDPRELATVLDWMLEGITRLVGRGGFAEQTASQQALTETIKMEGDTVYAYLKNELLVLRTEGCPHRCYSKKHDIYTAYHEAVLDSGQKPVAAPQFWRLLKSHVEANHQQLTEVRGGSRSDRTRLVNISKADSQDAAAWAWVEQATHKTAAIIPQLDQSDEDPEIPF